MSEEKNGQFAFITPKDSEENFENQICKIKESKVLATLRCLEENS